MGNPFTDTLIKQLRNDAVIKFVSFWDRLEALVIRVYKGKDAAPDDEREWSQVRAWLLKEYAQWRDMLHPYWQGTRIGGEPAKDDPFERLLSSAQAREFVGNWTAMQTLPAARQAINTWLVDLIKRQHQN
jgi:hypothetical protein